MSTFLYEAHIFASWQSKTRFRVFDCQDDFERRIKSDPKTFHWSTLFFLFSSRARKQCWTLGVFLNQPWFFERMLLKNGYACLEKNLSNTFERFDKMLTGYNSYP